MKLLSIQADESVIKAIIAAEITQLDISHLQIKRSAWGRTTVAVNDDIILRFPLTPTHFDNLVRERELLKILHGKIAFSTPNICFIGQQVAFDGYYKIPGEPLPPQRFSELSEVQQYNFATQLARFFWELHQAITVEKALKIGLNICSEDLEERATLSTLRRRFLPLIADKSQKKYAESVIQLLEEIQITQSDRTVIHGDLHAYNLTCNPTDGTLTGILDFENTAIDDFHWDFRYLLSWGHFYKQPEILLTTVLQEYTKLSGRDRSFERCLLYSAATDFYDLTWRTEEGYPIAGTISSRLDNSQILMIRLGLFN